MSKLHQIALDLKKYLVAKLLQVNKYFEIIQVQLFYLLNLSLVTFPKVRT